MLATRPRIAPFALVWPSGSWGRRATAPARGPGVGEDIDLEYNDITDTDQCRMTVLPWARRLRGRGGHREQEGHQRRRLGAAPAPAAAAGASCVRHDLRER